MNARSLAARLVPVALFLVVSGAWAQSITMASTTSTEQSGLFGHLLPEFKKSADIAINGS